MNRRFGLTYLAGLLVVMCPIVLPASGYADDAKPHWDYSGEKGPEHWGKLDPGFSACAEGLQQSPINLAAGTRSALADIPVTYREVPLKVVNNGHTIQVNIEPGSSIAIDGKRFDLLQVHFHHSSEHLLAGRSLPLEAHFVHAAADGSLAVLGVFFEPGRHNASLEPIWQVMPDEVGDAGSGRFDPTDLLPAERGYFRYYGSLTTPPCSQIVIWTVFKQALGLSQDQIAKFAAIFPTNTRPIQRLNRRFLLESQ